MPMVPTALKAKIKSRIYDGLKEAFSSSASEGDGYSAIADAQWDKIATAISGLAVDVVMEIVTNAMVLPGQVTIGSPVTQTTASPGKIL